MRTMAQATFRISHNDCISLHHKPGLPRAIKQCGSLVCFTVHPVVVNVWAAVFTFNPYLLISINMDTATIFIDINK